MLEGPWLCPSLFYAHILCINCIIVMLPLAFVHNKLLLKILPNFNLLFSIYYYTKLSSYIRAIFYINWHYNFNLCGIFEKMTSLSQILNQDLEQGKLMAAVNSPMFSPEFCLGESQGTLWENRGPVRTLGGQSYLRSMTSMEKILHDLLSSYCHLHQNFHHRPLFLQV